MKTLSSLVALAAFSALASFCAWAADPEVALVIKNHRFEPAELRVPAGQKIRLIVHNQDSTPEEFESHELNREKVIAPDRKSTRLNSSHIPLSRMPSSA